MKNASCFKCSVWGQVEVPSAIRRRILPTEELLKTLRERRLERPMIVQPPATFTKELRRQAELMFEPSTAVTQELGRRFGQLETPPGEIKTIGQIIDEIPILNREIVGGINLKTVLVGLGAVCAVRNFLGFIGVLGFILLLRSQEVQKLLGRSEDARAS